MIKEIRSLAPATHGTGVSQILETLYRMGLRIK